MSSDEDYGASEQESDNSDAYDYGSDGGDSEYGALHFP